jgi:ATP-dependent DNA helicase RecQ
MPAAPTLADARDVLKRLYGHKDFRGAQGPVIETLLNGQDALAILPTGAGKSVCYQIPALLRPGVGLVVSPLIALMQDQVAALTQAGVHAARLDSSLSGDERRRTIKAAEAGDIDLLYVSPEGLAAGGYERLQSVRVSLIAIDEAHCVSQWGHDFRPDYRGLARLTDAFPGAPRLAVTATADAQTRSDIQTQLRLEDAALFVASFDRANLILSAERKGTNATRRVVDLVKARAGVCGVIYAATRDRTETIAEALRDAGLRACAYHAGLDSDERARRQEKFQADDDMIMAATVAFGMGVDKPNVRFVIHADPPKSIEAYWQEVGRAGRDGDPAEGIALYGAADLKRSLSFIADSQGSDIVKAAQAKKARQLFTFFDALACRRQSVRKYFGEADAEPCGVCDNCLTKDKGIDITEHAAKALSAVLRMDQRFGRQRVIDHIMGKPARDDLDASYHSKTTYGCGKEAPEPLWRAVFDHLLFEGYLSDEGDDMRPILKIADGEGMRAVFAKSRALFIRPPQEKAERAKPGRARTALSAQDQPILATLKAWRRAVAQKAGVPPYVVFHDATLACIAEARPRTMHELARVAGVGEVKLARYGEQILTLTREAQAA